MAQRASDPSLGEAPPVIAHDELRDRLRRNTITVVDVLGAESYSIGHIPGALSLPIAELRERASVVLPDRHAEVAIYCGGFT